MVNLLFDHVDSQALSDFFSKDLIGSDKPTESQGKWVLTWLPRLTLTFLLQLTEKSFHQTFASCKTDQRGDREFLMLAMCSCCWIVGNTRNNWALLPQLMQIVLHLLLKDKKQKSGDKKGILAGGSFG